MVVVEVLRLGHRFGRDKRISTHVALTSRALGANKILFSYNDEEVKNSVNKITEQWGGDFKFEIIQNWKKYVKKFKENNGIVVHLTMYGLNINNEMEKIINENNNNKNILVIIGAEKVPKEAYELADYNLSIGNQPHSEVAAIAIFLDRLFNGTTLYCEYPNAKIKVTPSDKYKSVQINNK